MFVLAFVLAGDTNAFFETAVSYHQELCTLCG